MKDLIGKRIEYNCNLSQTTRKAIVEEEVNDTIYKVCLIQNGEIRYIGEGQINRILEE